MRLLFSLIYIVLHLKLNQYVFALEANGLFFLQFLAVLRSRSWEPELRAEAAGAATFRTAPEPEPIFCRSREPEPHFKGGSGCIL